jgi:23S rRNA pseudouridine1911/1915/1917 synthase
MSRPAQALCGHRHIWQDFGMVFSKLARLQQLFEVLFEDRDLLVVNKPAGLVCHPTKDGELSSLVSRARLYLGKASHPQLVNRLDRETGGVTLIAKTRVAAGELRRIWENRAVEKIYTAVVHGHPVQDSGIIDAPLGRDEGSKVAIKDCVRPDGLPASTEFRVERRFDLPGEWPGGFSLLEVMPRTGRKHQIRIHLAHIGHPIVGDKLYGGDENLYLAFVEHRLATEQQRQLILPCHALHAREVRFEWRNRPWLFCAEPEKWLRDFTAGICVDGL